jgi:cell division protein FtsI/penicillin-binding protein 2
LALSYSAIRRAPAWLGGALLAASLAASGSARASGPQVDARHVAFVEGKAVAPVQGGGTAKLTIDPALQRTAERLLDQARAPEGAVVVSDVRTGRILAWVSRGAARDYVATPFAPSASLFKVVTATALLDSGKATPATRQCYGAGGEHSVREKDLLGNGGPTCTSLGDALGKSVNLVFARLAHRMLTATDVRRTANQLGFGVEPMIDVWAQKSDVEIPDDPIGMARAAAGFGDGKVSPLTALSMMQTIANGGERVRLNLLDASPSRVSLGRAMSEKTALELRRMLENTTVHGTCAKVFHHPDGTRALPHTSVAAKTGTLVQGKPARMFSWFAGFAPVEKPEIAVAVMLGNDVRWWEKANEVGRDLLKAYFEGSGSSTHAIASRAPPATRER